MGKNTSQIRHLLARGDCAEQPKFNLTFFDRRSSCAVTSFKSTIFLSRVYQILGADFESVATITAALAGEDFNDFTYLLVPTEVFKNADLKKYARPVIE